MSQLNKEFESAKQRQFEPFPQDAELSAKVQRLVELTESLSLDRREEEPEPEQQKEEDRAAPRMGLRNRLQEAGAKAALRNGSTMPGQRRPELTH